MSTNSETKEEKYKSDRIHVVVHRKPNCIVEYEVEAFRPICIETQKKAAKNVGKEVVVPGFRKGKAPPEIVAKRYPDELDKRWQEAIANTAYSESASLANVPIIRPDATITFKMQSHSKDGAKMTLSFETVPQIPSIDPAKCALKEVKRPEVSKEKVDETIRQAQMFFGKWEMVQDRPIQEGDYVLLDVDIIEDDPPQSLFSNTRFEVSDRSMAQWMKKLVLGKKAHDVVEGVSIPDENLKPEEKEEYTPKKVRLTIKAIEKVELPELDDAFARNLGAESVEDLKMRVEKLLNKKADEHVREQQREQITEFLLSHPFETPQSVIEKETHFRMQQMLEDPKFKANWDQSTQQQKKEWIDSVKNQAERAVRIFYLCRKISVDQKISVTPQDLPMEEKDLLESLFFPSARPHDPRQPEVKQAEAYSRVLLEKTEDWVISHARTTPPEPKKEKKEEKPTPSKKKKTARKSVAKKAKPEEEKPKPKRKSAPKPKQKKAKP